MTQTMIDRDDPAGRAQLAVARLERRQRMTRVAGALALCALAAIGPVLAAPVATVAAIVASLFLLGCAVAVWPWPWSPAEREHHQAAAVWAQARPAAAEDEPWTRYATWATAGDAHVELVLIRRAGTAETATGPSPYTVTVKQRLDPDATAEAAIAMEALREQASALETRAHEQHLEALAAAARRPYDDALRAVDDAATQAQRRSEVEMRRELADEQAAERRAQAAAVARALRRP